MTVTVRERESETRPRRPSGKLVFLMIDEVAFGGKVVGDVGVGDTQFFNVFFAKTLHVHRPGDSFR